MLCDHALGSVDSRAIHADQAIKDGAFCMLAIATLREQRQVLRLEVELRIGLNVCPELEVELPLAHVRRNDSQSHCPTGP